MPVGGKHTVGCKCCKGCCTCLNNVTQPDVYGRTVFLSSILDGDEIVINDLTYTATIDPSGTSFEDRTFAIRPASYPQTPDTVGVSHLVELLQNPISKPPGVKVLNFIEGTSQFNLITDDDSDPTITFTHGFYVYPRRFLGGGDKFLLNIIFEFGLSYQTFQNRIGMPYTLQRSTTDPNIFKTIVYTSANTVYAALWIPKSGKPRAIYVEDVAHELTKEDFDSLGDRPGVLFECWNNLEIYLKDFIANETITIEDQIFTAKTATNLDENEFDASGTDHETAIELGLCVEHSVLNVTAEAIEDVLIVKPTNSCRKLFASVAQEFTIKRWDTVVVEPIGYPVKVKYTINGIDYIAHHNTTTLSAREFSVSSDNATDAKNFTDCVNDPMYGVPNVTAVRASASATKVILVPDDGEDLVDVKLTGYSKTATFNNVAVGDTITVNGVTFTAATVNNVTLKKFLVVIGRDDLTAFYAVNLVINPTFGLNTLITAERINNMIHFYPKSPLTFDDIILSGSGTFTFAEGYSRTSFAVIPAATYKHATITIDVTHVGPNSSITISDYVGGTLRSHEDITDPTAGTFAVDGDDAYVARNLATCINARIPSVFAATRGNRVTVVPRSGALGFLVNVGYESSGDRIRSNHWAIIDSNSINIVGWGASPIGRASLEAVLSSPLWGPTFSQIVSTPEKVFCHPSYVPDSIQIHFQNWMDQLQTSFYGFGRHVLWQRSYLNTHPISLTKVTDNLRPDYGRRIQIYGDYTNDITSNPPNYAGYYSIDTLKWLTRVIVNSPAVYDGTATLIYIQIVEKYVNEGDVGSGYGSFYDSFHNYYDGIVNVYNYRAAFDRVDDPLGITHWVKGVQNPYGDYLFDPTIVTTYNNKLNTSEGLQPIGDIIKIFP